MLGPNFCTNDPIKLQHAITQIKQCECTVEVIDQLILVVCKSREYSLSIYLNKVWFLNGTEKSRFDTFLKTL